MGDAPRPGDLTPLEQAQAYAEGRSDDVSRELVGEMLASHAALQAAGEEMPGLEKLAEAFMPGQPNACDPGCRFEDEADRVLDLFRPIVARLRQRAEAAEALAAERLARAERAERERDVMSERVAVVQEDHADMAKAHGERACEVVTLRTRVAELETARADVAQAETLMLATIQEKERLRQRAERAERELAECNDTIEALREDYSDAKEAAETLRARIAELEASREPGADVVRTCTDVYLRALNKPITQDMVELPSPRTAMAAVLSHLAAMGEEAWPDVNTIGRAMFGTVWERYFVEPERANHRKRFTGVLDLFRSRLSPVIGALRARVAELEGRTVAPPEALVEECTRVYWEAPGGPFDGIRAVLAHLARRGVEGLPGIDELVNTLAEGWRQDGAREGVRRLLDWCVAPLLAARDHEIATLRERLAAAEKGATL